MKDREKEILYLKYLKSEIIKQQKKEIKKLDEELKEIRGIKKLSKQKERGTK